MNLFLHKTRTETECHVLPWVGLKRDTVLLCLLRVNLSKMGKYAPGKLSIIETCRLVQGSLWPFSSFNSVFLYNCLSGYCALSPLKVPISLCHKFYVCSEFCSACLVWIHSMEITREQDPNNLGMKGRWRTLPLLGSSICLSYSCISSFTMKRKCKFLKALPNFRVTLELIRFDLTHRKTGWY